MKIWIIKRLAKSAGIGLALKSGVFKYAIPYLLIGGICLAIGYYWGSGQQAVIREPVTKFLSPNALRTTIPQFRSVPDVRFIHTERVDTVTRVDTIRVPAEFEYTGLIERRPLAVTRRNVYLTYYEPGTRQMVTEAFDVPQKRFWFDKGVHISANTYPWSGINAHSMGGFAVLRYRKIAVSGQVDYIMDENNFRSFAKLKLFF